MTVLALLRHAETAWSGAGRLQGRSDIALSPAGLQSLAGRQIPGVCQALSVVSSPLQRCTQTAAALGLVPVAIEPRIIEMSWGAWEGHTLAGLRASLGASMQENEARGLDFRPAGGESPREVWQRVQPWLVERAAGNQGTLAITHRGVLRVVMARALDWDMRGKPPVRLDWACVQLFALDARGEPRVLQLNLPLEGVTVPASGGQGG